MQFVPVPKILFSLLGTTAQLGLACSLYDRAHSLRWRPFTVRERQLANGSLTRSDVRTVLAAIEELDLGDVVRERTRGGRATGTRLRLEPPVATPQSSDQSADPSANHKANHSADHNDELVVGVAGDPEPQPEPQPEPRTEPHVQPTTSTETRDQDLKPETREREEAPPLSTYRESVVSTAEKSGETPMQVQFIAVAGVQFITEDNAQARALPLQDDVLRLYWGLGCPHPDAFLHELKLVAHAARECPDPMFARDIRGEGWEGKRDASRNVATVCRLHPDNGKGATWYERLRVASAWQAKNEAHAAAAEPVNAWTQLVPKPATEQSPASTLWTTEEAQLVWLSHRSNLERVLGSDDYAHFDGVEFSCIRRERVVLTVPDRFTAKIIAEFHLAVLEEQLGAHVAFDLREEG